jgi:hypothetical protein
VIEPEAKKLLRSQQGHAGLFGRTVAFSLITLYARGDKICRGAFTALCAGKYVIQRKVLRVLMIAAVLAAIAVADVNAGTLHCRLATVTSDVNVVPEPDDRRYWKDRRRRMKNIVAIVFFDKHRAPKPEANRTSYTDGTQRLVREIQK